MANLRYAPRRKRRRPIALDFDGVLHSSSDAKIGKPTDGAQDFVKWLRSNGWDPHIHTARDNTDDVSKWLKKHNFPPMPVSNRKQPSEVYVDDRGMRFTGRFDQMKKRLMRSTAPWHEEA